MSDAINRSANPGHVLPQIPDVELLRVIGQGAFGQVWLATNRTTGQLRAVKMISLQQSGLLDLAGREITSISRLGANAELQHPNLLTIHHAGRTDEHFFYIMDPADDLAGGPASTSDDYRPASLRNRLENGPLSPEECLDHATGLLAGLARLHAAGMVHRDVKPANCLFIGGQFKLGDFGLLAAADRQISRVGTQGYMPPDGRMDARADVYAAGLVIYEMLSGLPPSAFPRLGPRARQIAGDPPLSALNRLVLRACDPDPQRRFQDAGEMLAALEASRPEAIARRVRTRRRLAVWAALAMVAAAVIGMRFWPARLERVPVNFVSYPFEATIHLDGAIQTRPDGTPYKTPCTIKGLPARVHHVAFRREGLPPLDAGQIDFAKTRQIRGRWNPGN